MGDEYKSNIKSIVKNFKWRSEEVLEAGGKGVTDGLNFFQSKIIKEQMSGRVGNKGLNVQTGALRRSWFINTKKLAFDFIAKLSTSSQYAIAHEKGMTITPKNAKVLAFEVGGKKVFAKSVKIPKRLNIIADYRRSGIRIISIEILKQLTKALNKRR